MGIFKPTWQSKNEEKALKAVKKLRGLSIYYKYYVKY